METVPTRFSDDALKTIEEHRIRLQARRPEKIITRSDAVMDMHNRLMIAEGKNKTILEEVTKDARAATEADTIEREVKYSGNKAMINMPKAWAGKKVKIVEAK
jgi:putative transposon-encoded protein